MTYRLRNIMLAVALAVVAALLVTFYVASYKQSVQESEKNVTVYVAAREIAAGTTGAEALNASLLRPTKVARRNVVAGAISNPKQIETLVATETTYPDEQVTVSRFRPVKEGGIQAELKGNLRAVQVPGDGNMLLAGTLEKGAHVDVVAHFEVDEDRSYTRTILRDVLVLATSGATVTGSKLEAQNGDFFVQVAVTDAQAQKLFHAMKAAAFSLTLRPVVDAADSAETLETTRTLLCDGLNRNKPALCTGGR